MSSQENFFPSSCLRPAKLLIEEKFRLIDKLSAQTPLPTEISGSEVSELLYPNDPGRLSNNLKTSYKRNSPQAWKQIDEDAWQLEVQIAQGNIARGVNHWLQTENRGRDAKEFQGMVSQLGELATPPSTTIETIGITRGTFTEVYGAAAS